jgi:hypothetical protein
MVTDTGLARDFVELSFDGSNVAEKSLRRSPSPINEKFGSLRRGKLGKVSLDLMESESNVTDSESSDCRRLARVASVSSKELIDKHAEILGENFL